MKPGFYSIMAAQFFSSLADNALLIAAISLLIQIQSPDWMTPLLKLFFVLSYVLLAAYVGAFADSRPKGKVMFLTNSIKVIGCLTMLMGVHPLLAYAIVGFGAAAYSPAKYGILTELLPPEKLVAANGWIEGLTVCSIIAGTVLGGVLISPKIAQTLLLLDFPLIDTHIDTPPEAAIALIVFLYLIAALINLRIPETGVVYTASTKNPIKLIKDFSHNFMTLWNDRLGQISLAVTTLFWGIGATLQFIILKWAEDALDMNLSQGAILQAIVAFGVAGGAMWAAARVPLKNSLVVLKYGVIMGFLVITLAAFQKEQFGDLFVNLGFIKIHAYLLFTYIFLITIGWMSGYFVVPMNALLQHRGHVLLSAGHSIAIQNFNENLSVLFMLGLYSLLIWFDLPVQVVILLFGCFVIITMALVIYRHQKNQAQYDSLYLIGEEKHPHA
ncbi:lysophospholipid transporter LplT [Polynucleobacter sp. SHI8]|uniref:lysophospholipid transporter LplT n=1 Tax=unclassified Polynucleobacter TaxID=2640945 RepID=UPI002490E9B0|nr:MULTISPECIES: lysophospholipid transporter LplT [unclassified Polynucleobacter]BDW11076.1 lysophospholipid transporter LplT [Polynucleobacter sp. SHI2]BDW13522.1 lysophospholipid transporter LplT [Polynucleobacter sp. SHI8]